jgi:hypothetical protein
MAIISKFIITQNPATVTGTSYILEHGTLLVSETATPSVLPSSYILGDTDVDTENVYYDSLQILPDTTVTVGVDGILYGAPDEQVVVT